MLVGVFSPLPPTIDKSNMLDTGDEAPADVLVPSPEPSTMVLFGLGLMGIVGTVLRRRKS
jgi:carbohydrate-binding DOMON domain-containing protein